MTALTETMESPTSWFVGASFGRTDDQTSRFLSEGIWELKNPTDQDAALVKSMSAGDRIAIKAAYTRKHSLPFDNRGHTVSVMAIKATGTVTDNLGDGERVRVSWTTPPPIGEWYFFTYRATIWRVRPGDWMTDGLIAFAFEGKPQDTERFRNEPYWRERFGSAATGKGRFGWTNFYEAIAEKLLAYKDDRQALVKGIQKISLRVEGLGHLAQDQYAGGGTGFVKDICPWRRILIDTKFTSIVTSGWHREQTLRSGYLYQVYAYLRSQVGRGDLLADHAEGLLLHPAIGESVDEAIVIQGQQMRFATVDLSASAADIRSQLSRLCEPALT